jgi:hypothetical protein
MPTHVPANRAVALNARVLSGAAEPLTRSLSDGSGATAGVG